MNNEWTSEWPNQPGDYWFYGWTSKPDRGEKPRLLFVHAALDGQKKIVCHYWAEFIYRSLALGYWMRTNLPSLPSPENMQKLTGQDSDR